MIESPLNVQCGPVYRSGKRLVIVTYNEIEYRDRFDVDSAYHRIQFCRHVTERLGIGSELSVSLEQMIFTTADRVDQTAEEAVISSCQPVLIRMSDVRPTTIDWLWPQRIALGRVTLLVGRPGCGKSFLTCDMASRVSTGSSWPDGSQCQQGAVVLVTSEDGPEDTIRPRLDAHIADVRSIHLLKGIRRSDSDGSENEALFTLADCDALEQTLQACGDCRLIVIDPIGSFLGGRTDAHRDNEVRAVLAPIAALAEKYRVAVLLVAHTRKSVASYADDMALGSRAFTGIARSVWHLSCDRDDSQRRLLLPGKSNIAVQQDGLAFSIVGEPATLHWEQEPVKLTADDALEREQADPGQNTALEEAMLWLADKLRDGPRHGKELRDEPVKMV